MNKNVDQLSGESASEYTAFPSGRDAILCSAMHLVHDIGQITVDLKDLVLASMEAESRSYW